MNAEDVADGRGLAVWGGVGGWYLVGWWRDALVPMVLIA